MDFDNFVAVCKNIYLSPKLGFTKNAFLNGFTNHHGSQKQFIRVLISTTVQSKKTEDQRNKLRNETAFASDAADPLFYQHTSLDYATWRVAAAQIHFTADASLSPEQKTEMLDIIKNAATKHVAPRVFALKNDPPLPQSRGHEYIYGEPCRFSRPPCPES